ncbi:hypothetical protein H6G91_33230 [Nostoc muscorum FACHB-395]|nr:hypothetical protein [Desmonostoc muscorum FACHB-395]
MVYRHLCRLHHQYLRCGKMGQARTAKRRSIFYTQKVNWFIAIATFSRHPYSNNLQLTKKWK